MLNEDNIVTLLGSDEFKNAVEEGVALNSETVTSCKSRDKDNFERFYELMLDSDEEIQAILNKRKKNRTDDENTKVKQFKKKVTQMYKQTQLLLSEEDVEEGKKTRVEKLVEKIFPVITILKYIGENKLEVEFRKNGITLQFNELDNNQYLSNDTVKQNIKNIFTNAKAIKDQVNDQSKSIADSIFMQIPVDLQFDKDTNPAGMKPSGFKKLVDLKTRLALAKTDESKDKVNEKIHDLIVDTQFDRARNNLMMESMTAISESTEEQQNDNNQS